MNNNYYINNKENVLTRKTGPLIICFTIISIVIILILICISLFYKYIKYENITLKVVKNEEIYYLETLVSKDNLRYFIKNNELIIDDEKYPYEITNISDELYLDSYNNMYYKIILETTLESNKIINNNILLGKTMIKKTTLFKELLSNLF